MSYTLPPPTADGVRTLHNKLLKDWGPRMQTDREFQDLVHNRQRIETLQPDEDRNIAPIELHSGRSGGIIEQARGLVMAPPSWSVESRMASGTPQKEQEEQVERAAAAIFEQQLLANDFWSSVARDVLIYGRGYIKALPLPWVWTTQAGYPVRNEGEEAKAYLARVEEWKAADAKFPFVIQHISALNVLPLLTAEDVTMATIEEKRIMAHILADDLGSAEVKSMLSSGEVHWYDELPVAEYIDQNYVGYYLLGRTPYDGDEPSDISASVTSREYTQLIPPFEHGLGKCPVVMIPGIRTELNTLDGRFKSFLADAKEPLERYDFLLSRLATMVSAYYMPSYFWTLPDSGVSAGGKERPTMRIKLGGVTVKYADEIVEPMPTPPNLPPAELLMAHVDDMIQRHTLEDVLFGRVQGSAPAFQVNLRINVARSKLTPIALHMAQGITNVMDIVLRGVERLGETIIVDGEKLTPTMAKAVRGRLNASIQPKTPFDRNSDLGAAKIALEIGMPFDWVLEEIMDVQDPATLRIAKLIEELEKTQPVQERLVAEALQKLDLMIQDKEFGDISQLGQLAPDELKQVVDEMIANLNSGGGLGRGPYPPGSAPQTVGGGRGLETPKEQPQPGGVGIPSMGPLA